MFECLNDVDWDLLNKQKLTLISLLLRQRTDDSDDSEDLNGILHFLDRLQDDAVDVGLWECPQECEQ